MPKNNPFLQLTRDEQANVVRPLMSENGASYGSVAKRLDVLRGRIAGICRDYEIRTERSAGFTELPKSSSGRVLKLAPPGPTQCEARVDGHQCAFVKELESRYCGLPAHQMLAKRSS